MYAWAHEAPPLVLPSGVGYQLSNSLRYVVAEVHYGHESDGLLVKQNSLSINIILSSRLFWD